MTLFWPCTSFRPHHHAHHTSHHRVRSVLSCFNAFSLPIALVVVVKTHFLDLVLTRHCTDIDSSGALHTMLYKTLFVATAAFSGLVAGQNSTASGSAPSQTGLPPSIQPCCSISADNVPENLKNAWCQAEQNTCPQICGGQGQIASGGNDCDTVCHCTNGPARSLLTMPCRTPWTSLASAGMERSPGWPTTSSRCPARCADFGMMHALMPHATLAARPLPSSSSASSLAMPFAVT